MTVYRCWSHPKYQAGRFVSRIRPAGPLQTQLDLALAPQWGNNVSEFVIPRYTRYYEGFVGEQPVKAIEDSDTLDHLPGGGNQILVTDEGLINQWKSPK
ncbi:hypothetical protein FYJ43_02170 [Cutibacterium sp. WCA-380-WT-3A]|uniref:Uncharacterized protein n=1 Tax=Cutibacterium porci TaxID=2605781 RepID=A0A7K0J4L7_9ACTN|nr:hypothetical protein [Cutibacterium porci]